MTISSLSDLTSYGREVVRRAIHWKREKCPRSSAGERPEQLQRQTDTPTRRHIAVPVHVCLSVALIFACCSCDIINPEEPLPAYIYVEDIKLETVPAREGSASAKITEVWLTVDDNFLGAYPLPAWIPILERGNSELKLRAGIRDNGISATPEIYPFYETVSASINLQPLQTDTLSPKTQYLADTKFALIENFENGAGLFSDIRVGGPDGGIQINTTESFEGNASAEIRLTDDRPIVEIATSRRYSNLTASSPFVYLEVNYKSEGRVSFGIVGYETRGSSEGIAIFVAGFAPRPAWNKIYFNLSPILATANFPEYQIVLQAVYDSDETTNNPAESIILLDGIKLVHF